MDELVMTQEKTKGRGLIHVHVLIWEDLGKPETPDEWHKALLLPDSYTIERVDGINGVFTVVVKHTAIPTDRDHITSTEVIPFYGVNYVDEVKGSPYLDRIEINQWNGQTWEKVAITDRREDHA